MRSGNQVLWVVLTCAVALVLPCLAHGDTETAVREVLKTVDGPNMVDSPRASTTPEGYIRFVGAPQDNWFQSGAAGKGPNKDIDAMAKGFILDHGPAFGIKDSGLGFITRSVKSENARSVVRLDQVYKGVPVFGAQAVVQLKADGSIISILSDIMRDAPRVYSGALSLTPTITAGDATLAAVDELQNEHPAYTFDSEAPVLYLYAPSVLGQVGQVKLAFSVKVSGEGNGLPVGEQILIDAHMGATLSRIPTIYSAKFRTIYDAENVVGVDPGTLKRSEGNPATGIIDVDEAYDYYGDTYDFYFTQFGRDSIDGAGLVMDATVRWCPDSSNCPLFNAFWFSNSQRMYFGDGFAAADDVVAHELTHGVTESESNLIYQGESGALNESMSDVFGEFVDQVNGAGTDTPQVKWLMGEDVPGLGAIRNMANPPQFGDPDRYKGPNWYSGGGDNGGVHINSGVSNKLCFLLTDGQAFNGFSVSGMGIDTVSKLYYRCNAILLGNGSDYPDFGDAIVQAAKDLGLDSSEVDNVYAGLYATQIKTFEGLPVRYFRAAGKSGDNRIALTWYNPTAGPYNGVDIVRKSSGFPTSKADGTLIASTTSTAQSYVDTPGGGAGTNYYYAIFSRLAGDGFNLPQYTRGTVGVNVDFLTEPFANGTDLAFSQITFVPSGDLPLNVSAEHLPDFYNHTNYEGYTVTQSKVGFGGTLPVAKVDYYELPLSDDGGVNVPLQFPVPFFGRFLSNIILSANGNIVNAEDQYDDYSLGVTTSLQNHYALPRISFLYGDLNPRAGGEVWLRYLDDRTAITFENVPLFDDSVAGNGAPGNVFTNTVQCELFNSGKIRFTYLDLTAKRAVVGLSDGRGIPFNVDDIFAGSQTPQRAVSNLNALPGSVGLELDPIPIQYVESGSSVNFTALAHSTIGTPTYAVVVPPSALGVDPMYGATIDPQTGAFVWDTTGFADGVYGIILCAAAGGETVCQTVGAVISTSTVLPEVTNPVLNPAKPKDGENLVASYNYSHPSLPEGPSVLYWFKNNAMIPAYTNQTLLPHDATKPGETWYFRVLPATIAVGNYGGPVYLYGESVKSNEVVITQDVKVDTNGDGKVNSVDLQLVVQGLLGTGAPDIDPDVNGDGHEDASDAQTTINYILDKH